MSEPPGDTWVDLMDRPLPVERIVSWATRPSCGAVVTFYGTARDHSPGREQVEQLSYEAYESVAVARLGELADEMRVRWPDVVAIALVHRTGDVPIGESAVVVAVSSPHRDAAFEAARFGIDALKQSVPIWKRERWVGGESWGLEPQHLVPVGDVPSGEVPA